MDDPPRRRNDPPRKKRHRGRIPSEQHPHPRITIMELLDDASLEHILDFLPGHFRFVASVDRRFRSLYQHHHAPNTVYMAAMTSNATRERWLQEDAAFVREDGCRFAAKYGNLEALQWFRSHDCRWNSDVCREAAAGGHLHTLHWARS